MKTVIKLNVILTSLFLVNCGGGSSSNTNQSTSSAKISGTVPGTLIEVFCDNRYYKQVTSTQNGTDKHPFSIDVPTNTNCKLVMTTNENNPENRIITPIAFTNGSTIVVSKDVDLGNIPLEIHYANAEDRDGDHVVDTPLKIATKNVRTNNQSVQDKNNNGVVDAYDDDDDDNVVNAYEDDDHDGVENIHDDDDSDGLPDHIDDDDGDDNTNHENSRGGDNKDMDDNSTNHENSNDRDNDNNDLDDHDNDDN
jgi:hypothetical protein